MTSPSRRTPAASEALARCQRDRQREGGAAAAPLRNDDVAAHRARQLLDRRQSEPGAAEARGDA